MASNAPALLGPLLALGSAALYGVNIVSTRLAAAEGVSGVTVVFYRSFVMLGLVAAAAGLWRSRLHVPPEERGVLLILGLATTAIGAAYLSSVAFIPVTVAAVIFYTFPVMIVLASPLIDGTRLTGALLALAGVALVGVVLVVGPAFEGLDPRGLVLALVASVATTVQFFAATRCKRTGVVAKVLWIHVLVLPASAAIGMLAGSLDPPRALLLAPLAVTVTVVCYVFGFALQFLALARTSAVVAGIAFCFEPVMATLSSVLFLGERLAALQILGGTLVLAAIVANVLLQQRRPSAEKSAALEASAP
jgi:drug/metabolite transporter (DMT)-like permease